MSIELDAGNGVTYERNTGEDAPVKAGAKLNATVTLLRLRDGVLQNAEGHRVEIRDHDGNLVPVQVPA